MSSAVGGVEVCTDAPIYDENTGLDLPTAGTHVVEGYTALAFLRTRKGVGDGSDLGRISSQQVYLSSMIRKVQSDGVLTDPGALYGLAKVTTESMQLSTSLASLDTMASMARVLADMPTENIVFVQYPGTIPLEGPLAGRVIPLEDEAAALLQKIRDDERFLPDEPENGTAADPDASITPSPSATGEPEVLENVPGQTAADRRCSVANG